MRRRRAEIPAGWPEPQLVDSPASRFLAVLIVVPTVVIGLWLVAYLAWASAWNFRSQDNFIAGGIFGLLAVGVPALAIVVSARGKRQGLRGVLLTQHVAVVMLAVVATGAVCLSLISVLGTGM